MTASCEGPIQYLIVLFGPLEKLKVKVDFLDYFQDLIQNIILQNDTHFFWENESERMQYTWVF